MHPYSSQRTDWHAMDLSTRTAQAHVMQATPKLPSNRLSGGTAALAQSAALPAACMTQRCFLPTQPGFRFKALGALGGSMCPPSRLFCPSYTSGLGERLLRDEVDLHRCDVAHHEEEF